MASLRAAAALCRLTTSKYSYCSGESSVQLTLAVLASLLGVQMHAAGQ